MENILPHGGTVMLYPDFFTAEESSSYLHALMESVPWKQEPIKMFGKTVMQPRLTAWYGDPGKSYTYSGITMQPLVWTDTLTAIKSKVEQTAGVSFNSALLNCYRDGLDSMGWHRDNESSLGDSPVIASVSFGAERVFQLRHYQNHSLRKAVILTNGSLLIMKDATQHNWQHGIPKITRPLGPRVNITFRTIVN